MSKKILGCVFGFSLSLALNVVIWVEGAVPKPSSVFQSSDSGLYGESLDEPAKEISANQPAPEPLINQVEPKTVETYHSSAPLATNNEAEVPEITAEALRPIQEAPIINTTEIVYASAPLVANSKTEEEAVTEEALPQVLIEEDSVAHEETVLPTQLDHTFPAPLLLPAITKGIYASGYGFAHQGKRSRLLDLLQNTELNTIVIDIQDDRGKFMFRPHDESLDAYPLSPVAFSYEELEQILADFQNNNVYTIARVVTFQAPIASQLFPDLVLKNKHTGQTWTNWQGISWLDMTNKKTWDLPINKAKSALAIGFDEVQFDYIRFPSDGKISDIKYHNLPEGTAKHEIMKDFFAYQYEALKAYPHKKSADFFGFTYHEKNKDYDLNIGQRIQDSIGYFDYLSPMVYPSHYPAGYLGIKNPNTAPGRVVAHALNAGNNIMSALVAECEAEENVENDFDCQQGYPETRAWIQDFDLGAKYTADKVRAQIEAVQAEENQNGWLLWNARNVYNQYALEEL